MKRQRSTSERGLRRLSLFELFDTPERRHEEVLTLLQAFVGRGRPEDRRRRDRRSRTTRRAA